MTRRDFATALALSAEAAHASPASPLPLIKPPALKPGDTVGLITPSSNVEQPQDLDLAVKTVRDFGLNPRLGRNTSKRTGYLAGTVQERLDDLHAMFRDPEVRGIWCIRGGYGAPQLLDQIDYALVRANPKVFLGYSDITALHLAFNRFAGLVTFHGPVVIFHGGVAQFNNYTLSNLKRVIFQTGPIGRLAATATQTIRAGTAHGRLIGGNLSIICALMGTPYEIDSAKALLFTEEVGEAPYRIDRMLTQLRLAGKLRDPAGIVFGECTECVPVDCKLPAAPPVPTATEVVSSILAQARCPVFAGLPIGHTTDQLTVPVGLPATLDADRGELLIEEAAVT